VLGNHQWRLLVTLVGIALLLTVTVGAVGAANSAYVPPSEPRNGLNESAFHALWSLEPEGSVESPETVAEERRNQTDSTFVTPPETPAIWNRNEIERFKGGDDTDTSIYPPDATLSDGQWIKDGYVSVFAVQPSTVLHRATDQTTHYVGAEGELLATSDYRIEVPDGSSSQERRVSWSIDSHEVETARIMIGGNIDNSFGRQRLDDATPGHTIHGNFTGAERGMTELGVEAEITVTLEKHVETRSCSTDDDGDTTCSDWSSSYSYPSESVVVDDYVDATYYTVQSNNYYTYNPIDQEFKIVTGTGTPFNSIRLPEGDRALGVWNYYTARDTTWDALTVSDRGDTSQFGTTILPVQVHAYPSRSGIGTIGAHHTNTTIDPGEATIYYRSGGSYIAPTLPDTVSVDVPNGTYNTSSEIAVSHPVNDPDAVEIEGIVRGTDADLSPGDTFYREIPTKEPTIDVETTALEESPNVRLDISLREPDGTPIQTDLTDDSLTVAGETVETDANGEASITLPQGQLPTQVYYQPTYFWDRGETAYTAASTRVGSTLSLSFFVSPIVRIIGLLVFFWTPFWLLDRAFAGDYWPPWRGIW
jgi:hypothetical protein